MGRVLFVMVTLVILALALLVALDQARGDCPVPPRVTYSRPVYSRPIYSTPTYYEPPVVVKEVVKEVVFTKFVPVVPVALVELAVLPTYSAQFVQPPVVQQQQQPGIPQPSPIQQAPALQQSDMAKIMGMLERINSRLDRLEKGGPIQLQPKEQLREQPKKEDQVKAQPELPTPLNIVQNKCAMCHSDKTSGQWGKSFVLVTSGVLEKLSPKQINKLVGHVTRGSMPPKEKPDNWVGDYPLALTDPEAFVLTSEYTK